MEGNEQTWIGIAGGLVTAVVAYLVGDSGLLNKIWNRNKEIKDKKASKEEANLLEYKEENRKLRDMIGELNTKVTELERTLAIVNERNQILIAYFEKINPEGDTFIKRFIDLAKMRAEHE